MLYVYIYICMYIYIGQAPWCRRPRFKGEACTDTTDTLRDIYIYTHTRSQWNHEYRGCKIVKMLVTTKGVSKTPVLIMALRIKHRHIRGFGLAERKSAMACRSNGRFWNLERTRGSLWKLRIGPRKSFVCASDQRPHLYLQKHAVVTLLICFSSCI